jgi:hypothetical protein
MSDGVQLGVNGTLMGGWELNPIMLAYLILCEGQRQIAVHGDCRA